ncbi:MAG TPA: RNA polymerase sigma-70 factor [Streptosporangiaceae bacterium]|nr:RNA polymerase sigma-70 factor [Streptosporangiaceae bacterium]
MTSGPAYQQYRPLMFAIAYRMLGSVSEAEDVVQEAFLRYHRAESTGTGIESPKAFLSAVTTRLCIDELRSARARREAYPGEWLPEPLLTGGAVLAGPPPDDPATAAEQADTLSMAFLLLLERLSPVERAAFLLHDVFSYGYDEVASIVGKSEDNCRQLALRARRHIAAGKPRFEASRGKRDELAATFFRAVRDGDLDGLVGMLAADVVVVGDNAGVEPRWPRPITGRDRVGRLLVGLARQIQQAGVLIRPAEINGQPGALGLDSGGRIVNVFVLEIADGQVHAIRSVISPGKLRHLGPLADLDQLRGQWRANRGQ